MGLAICSIRLGFVGIFQLWAKLRRPLDVVSVVLQAPKLPSGTGGELAVSNRAVVAGNTADLTVIEAREGNLRR